jgi:dihydroxyacid dehydratase/phosphogluconate dehydratase
MDEIVKLFDGYSADKYYEFRGAANIIVDETVIYCRHHRLDFVLDGTFGSGRAVDNIRSALKRHQVTIFYVWKDPTTAWQHTKDRQLVTKRGIEKLGFIESCINVPNNLRDVREKYADKISIALIRKDLSSNSFQMTRDQHVIDDLLEVSYTKDNLERILL